MKSVALALLCLGVAPAQDARLPWYMQETELTRGGRQTFLAKPWWQRAAALKEGEHFTLDLNHDGRPDTMIYREHGHIIEAIDDTGKADNILNRTNTCYLVSFKGTGLVDRMVAYLDNEIDYRHYQDGYLRYSWFIENYDRDGSEIMELKDWVYVGENGKKNKFRGNEMIYLNKYDPDTGRWVPLSECPFAFWDDDHDGRSEIALRVSAAPLGSNKGPDEDYANNGEHLWTPKPTPADQIGNMNVRLSYNIDPQPRREPVESPHYTFGFTMLGEQPYQYPDMFYTNPRRRPPQTVVRIPWKSALGVAENYPAEETGFSWDEARARRRWEGVFWIFERRYLPNTGGPTLRWNQRREYSSKPSARREIYYSEVDKRYHLAGAKEAWLEVGHLVNERKDLEIRSFDSDEDGYLDTWQVFEADNPVPVRVTHTDPRARPVPLTRSFLVEDYNRRVLPQAIRENSELIAALKKFAESPLAHAYEEEAARTEWAEARRYCLDIARELYFLKARDVLYAKAAAGPYPRLEADKGSYTLADSLRFWKASVAIEKFVEHYGAGRLVEA